MAGVTDIPEAPRLFTSSPQHQSAPSTFHMTPLLYLYPPPHTLTPTPTQGPPAFPHVTALPHTQQQLEDLSRTLMFLENR